ncbi:MAG TPA: hypothetical protein VHD31_01465 [Candidatus Paceibacterota bacterium]|nr:hypothetical protein [Candidatus Paceibacterota bacterium]
MDPEAMLKGRMAEALVEEMLKKAGNTVYRFGYESVIQNLVQAGEVFDRYTEVGEKLRAIPDFVVIDKNGRPAFVEVKFRWNSEIHADDVARLEKIEKYWRAAVIFVNCIEKPFFRISEPPYLSADKLLQLKPLTSISGWNVTPELIEEYERVAQKYFAPTLVTPSQKGK